MFGVSGVVESAGSMAHSLDLAQVLVTCIQGCLITQQYIVGDMLNMGKVAESLKSSGASSILQLRPEERVSLLAALTDSMSVDVKGDLAYKQGEASHDLVTSADLLTQEVVVAMLKRRFPDIPFTIVGEEEPEKRDTFAPDEKVELVISKYGDQFPTIPYEADLNRELQDHKAREVTGASIEDLRSRVGIFIDPIDGTNCFVEGVWEAPMTLVGITVDGLPIAAVANRVFQHDGTPYTPEHAPSISFIWNYGEDSSVAPFLVFDGKRVVDGPVTVAAQSAACTDSSARVTCSSTTKDSFLTDSLEALSPTLRINARGAGNKLFYLIKAALVGSGAVAADQARMLNAECSDGMADIFVCPGSTIMKWDTCAPHAFILALGGELYSRSGQPIRYPLSLPSSIPEANVDLSSKALREFCTALPDGLVAVNSNWRTEASRRLQW